jgi:hypothetical protein
LNEDLLKESLARTGVEITKNRHCFVKRLLRVFRRGGMRCGWGRLRRSYKCGAGPLMAKSEAILLWA